MFRHVFLVTLFLFSKPALAQGKGIKIAFRLNNNHIYLQGVFNDSLSAWILLDCGAGTIVCERLAKKAGINTKPFGSTIGTGNYLKNFESLCSEGAGKAGFSYTFKPTANRSDELSCKLSSTFITGLIY